MIRIICCDIDGTLVNDRKEITKANIEAIKKAINSGIKFVLVSGRMPTGTAHFYSIIKAKGLYSVYNGGALYDENDKLIKEERLDSEIAQEILSLARQNNLESILFDGDDWFLESRDGYIFDRKINIYKKDCKIIDFETGLDNFKTNKYLLMDEDRNKLIEFIDILKSNGIDEKKVTFYLGPDFLELMPSNVNKGTAIIDLCDHYDIKKSEVLAIGDDYNDISMFNEAGIAVAMGNSHPEVKEKAHFITDTNNNDGVSKAIYRYCFMENKGAEV